MLLNAATHNKYWHMNETKNVMCKTDPVAATGAQYAPSEKKAGKLVEQKKRKPVNQRLAGKNFQIPVAATGAHYKAGEKKSR